MKFLGLGRIIVTSFQTLGIIILDIIIIVTIIISIIISMKEMDSAGAIRAGRWTKSGRGR